MLVRSLALPSLLAAAVLVSGCNIRGAKQAPAPAPGPDAAALANENARLSQQVQELRDELNKNKAGTVGDDATAIAGGDIAGFERTARGGVALPEDFAFAKGSAELNEAGTKAIASLGQRLNEAANKDKQVFVIGHTDHTPVSRPSTKEKYGDNWGLSAARSAAVVRALEHAGINPQRLHGAFRGEHQPRVPVSDAAENKDAKKDGERGEAANRRVEIELAK